MSAPYILVVDDEKEIHSLVQEILEDEGYEVDVAENGEQARRARRTRRPDLILLDIWMPDVDGITLLKEWSDTTGLDTPVIVMSGHATVETAVEATRLGAYDFIEKPLSLAKLLLTVQHALEASKLHRENVGLRRYVHPHVEPIGKSPTMQQLREQAQRIAQHDTSVLLSGEPGSGKHVFAHYIHTLSPRRNGPFIDAEIASISSDNAAKELFGSEQGEVVSFGLLERANGGTLLLNDIGEIDMSVQARLFSALRNQRFHRVGGSEAVRVNVRVIAATHYDIEALVRAEQFRQDLYYQLNVLPLHIPSLRQHCEDVPELLQYYANLYATRDNLSYRNFSTAAQNRLRNYHWPGNIKELDNMVQRLMIIGNSGDIELKEVESALGTDTHQAIPQAQEDKHSGFELPLREAREQYERSYLEHHLRQMGGNVGKVAQIVGMERTHLYRKLRSLGIDYKEVSADVQKVSGQ